MDISTGLITKGTAGALAASAAVGTGVAANNDWFGLFNKSAEPIEGAVENKVVQEGLVSTGEEDPGVVTEQSRTTDVQNPEGGIPAQPPGSNINGNQASDPSGPGIAVGGLKGDVSLTEAPQNNELTKFDQGLITWLETTGNDIVFSIKYKPTGEDEKEIKNSDTSTNFSSFINGSSDPVKVSMVVNDNSKNLKGSGDKASLKQLNKNKKWTWECRMTFKKEPKSSSIDAVNQDQVNRVYGDGEKGLFRKLMKDVSTSNDDSIKELKKEFIKNCAKARTAEENEKINAKNELTNDKIETQKNKIGFVLEKGGAGNTWGTNEAELYFNDEAKFNLWFPVSAAQ